jgi:hypothetical protein
VTGGRVVVVVVVVVDVEVVLVVVVEGTVVAVVVLVVVEGTVVATVVLVVKGTVVAVVVLVVRGTVAAAEDCGTVVGTEVVAGETLLFATVVVVARGRATVVVVTRGRAMVVVGASVVVDEACRTVFTEVGGMLFSLVFEESTGVLSVGTKAGMLTATTRPSVRVALISTVCWPGSRSLGTMIWDEKLPSVFTGILFKSRGVENTHT